MIKLGCVCNIRERQEWEKTRRKEKKKKNEK